MRTAPSFAPAAIARSARPGGGFILRSTQAAPTPARSLGDLLAHWAAAAPDRTFLAERPAHAATGWRALSYAHALAVVRSLAQGLLGLGLAPRRPLLVLSGNSIDHALLALAAMHVGVPVAPVSPAYSLMSADHAKLRVIAGLLEPGAIFAADPVAFAPALAALAPSVPVLDGAQVAALARTTVSSQVQRAHAAVAGDTVGKILFTSGSTGTPKGVVNTQRMMCTNQAAIGATWTFLRERPPVIVDWLPWSHTFGGNHNFNLILANGGTLYIDHGKPAQGAFDETLRNLREIPSTIHFNVPRGFDLLVGALETDATLRDTFFRELDVMFYAAAALSPATWARFEAVSGGRGRIAMTSAWGSTETTPLITQVHFPIDRAGVIGLPVPGLELAFVPVADKLEMRVRGDSVAPGYLAADGAVEPLPRDELGFYPMGDAGRLDDDARPERGVVFDGRTAENFKLATGTWVHVGELRIALLAACSPLVTDAVITGHDRDEIGALVIPAPGRAVDAAWHAELAAGLARLAAVRVASSTRVTRALVLDSPPSIDAGEITDKGYLNQAALIASRASQIAKLYSDHHEIVRAE